MPVHAIGHCFTYNPPPDGLPSFEERDEYRILINPQNRVSFKIQIKTAFSKI